ncbi:MAG: hypothetical protein KF799_13505 [Bdellovibrionales bacterium]|nr:hypothetical protein [Bdellovibrionales bacterium]
MKALLSDFYTEYIRPVFDLPKTMQIFAIFLLLIVFCSFRINEQSDREQTTQAVKGILRSEYRNANSYALSKALADLEALHILRCTTLVETGSNERVFYDTSRNRACWKTGVGRRFFEMNTEFSAINGLNYRLAFQAQRVWSTTALELLIHLFVGVVVVVYARHWRFQTLNSDLRLKVLALEKDMAIDNAKQIKHDVAAPIGALRMMIQTLRNVDPEVKSVLNRALHRAEDIFSQLIPGSTSPVELLTSESLTLCLEEVISEKRLQWSEDCKLISSSQRFSGRVYANANELKRIVSNILNNSFESLFSERREISLRVEADPMSVTLRIKDSGIGMTPEVLRRIGQKGFSSGKNGHPTAGQGLGVSNAISVLRTWGGDLRFESQVGQGSEAIIRLNLS